VRWVRKQGDAGLRHRLRGRRSNHKAAEELKQRAIGLYREKKQARLWHDYGPPVAAEELAEQHGIEISRETLGQWLIEAKLWRPRRGRFLSIVLRACSEVRSDSSLRMSPLPFANRLPLPARSRTCTRELDHVRHAERRPRCRGLSWFNLLRGIRVESPRYPAHRTLRAENCCRGACKGPELRRMADRRRNGSSYFRHSVSDKRPKR